jgi:acyl-CoA thioesterase FadM
VSADCQFIAPMGHQEKGELRSRIVRWGGKSFVVAHRAVREDGTLLARGSETRVWGVYAAGPGSPLKGETIGEELKALFRAK